MFSVVLTNLGKFSASSFWFFSCKFFMCFLSNYPFVKLFGSSCPLQYKPPWRLMVCYGNFRASIKLNISELFSWLILSILDGTVGHHCCTHCSDVTNRYDINLFCTSSSRQNKECNRANNFIGCDACDALHHYSHFAFPNISHAKSA